MSFPPSSDSSMYSTYSSTHSTNSAQTFHTDNSTSSNSTPNFPDDTFSNIDSDDDSIKDFQIKPKSETVNKDRALFHVAEIPFDTVCQVVKNTFKALKQMRQNLNGPYLILIGTRKEILARRQRNSN